jgi:cell division initiation protein
MRVTPLDIIQKKFSMNKKGYDPEEVGAFLEEVREGLEELIRENHEQKGSLSEKEKEIARLRSDEDAVKETLMVARKFSEDMNGSARREADLLLGEARLDAQRVLSQAHDEHRELLQEVIHLKSIRLQHLAEMRAILETHNRLIQDVESRLEAAPESA